MENIFMDVLSAVSEVIELNYVSEDWGQLNFEQPPVNWPCALIDLSDGVYQNTSALEQRADITLTIRLGDIRFNGVTSYTPAELAQNAFAIYGIMQKVHQKLQGAACNGTSAFSRVSLKKIERQDSVREFVMSYKFRLTE